MTRTPEQIRHDMHTAVPEAADLPESVQQRLIEEAQSLDEHLDHIHQGIQRYQDAIERCLDAVQTTLAKARE